MKRSYKIYEEIKLGEEVKVAISRYRQRQIDGIKNPEADKQDFTIMSEAAKDDHDIHSAIIVELIGDTSDEYLRSASPDKLTPVQRRIREIKSTQWLTAKDYGLTINI
ncbi:MAG TPA: hypothetical protein PKD79_03055 [Candidatus Doudnabacteria bacterium]|mgnify:CR=1 FL=1|nr:hypothetical protein [Candidatus Doudnabacteria bacterium]